MSRSYFTPDLRSDGGTHSCQQNCDTCLNSTPPLPPSSPSVVILSEHRNTRDQGADEEASKEDEATADGGFIATALLCAVLTIEHSQKRALIRMYISETHMPSWKGIMMYVHPHVSTLYPFLN